MAFHVEISAGLNHARVFNLSQEDVVAKVVEPWLRDKTIEMGERKWQPRTSSLVILEGPRMETVDLSFGQGWSNAERASKAVTREILSQTPPASMPDAFVIETPTPEAVTADLVGGHGGQTLPWSEIREKVDGRDPTIAAVILVVRRPEES